MAGSPLDGRHRYELDGRVLRLADARGGVVLLGGEPFRLFRLTAAGAEALDQLLGAGAPPAARPSAAAEALADRLVAAGVLHPCVHARHLGDNEVAVVVPVRDDAGRLARLLHGIRRGYAGRIIVVDDGSRPGSSSRIDQAASRLGADLTRLPSSAGPGAARNAAADAFGSGAPPSLVAFVDADVVPSGDWLDSLAGHFDRPEVGAAAPRVRAMPSHPNTGWTARALAAFETLRSPLDLGASPAAVGAHRRVSYVPAAALVCRRAALDDVGWFDPSLRVGEDVDLVRRLEEAGWSVRFEPRAEVWHDPRGGFVDFARQRFRYGASAAALERRHPGTVAPFEGTPWGVAGAAAVVVAVAGAGAARVSTAAAGAATAAATAGATAGAARFGPTLPRLWDTFVPKRPETPRAPTAATAASLVAVIATAVPTSTFARKLAAAGVPDPGRTALRLVVRAETGSLAGLATALRRVWWPPVVVVAGVMPRLRRRVFLVLTASEVAAGLGAWRRRPRRPKSGGIELETLALAIVLGAVDDLAYGAGVWFGCLREGSFRALAPRRSRSSEQEPERVVTPGPTDPSTSSPGPA